MIRIDTNEIDKLVIDLEQIGDDVKADVQKVLKNTGFKIEANAKANLTRNRSVKTGHLRQGVTTDVGNMEVTVHTSNIKYSVMVEKGTKAHTIRPKSKKALYWRGAKHPVKEVNHPGSRAKPFLIPAFEKEKDNFIKEVKKVIRW